MNGDETPQPDDSQIGRMVEGFVIVFVTLCIGLSAMWCVWVLSQCVIYKIPDMNTTASNAFMHIADTLIGALLGWTAKSAIQRRNNNVKVVNPASDPVQTEERK